MVIKAFIDTDNSLVLVMWVRQGNQMINHWSGHNNEKRKEKSLQSKCHNRSKGGGGSLDELMCVKKCVHWHTDTVKNHSKNQYSKIDPYSLERN